MTQPSVTLHMQSGPNVGERYPLSQDVVFIGRDLQNDIVISDAEVSRRHARLTRLPNGTYEIEDLGSTNGTFINGMRLVGKQVLARGDIVMLGSNVLLEVEVQAQDPNATMVSAPRPQTAAQPQVSPQAPAPQTPPPSPQSAFVGNVPQSPGDTDRLAQAGAQKKGRSIGLLLGCGAVVVFGCIAVAAVLWYIDSHYLWCTVLPILPGCP